MTTMQIMRSLVRLDEILSEIEYNATDGDLRANIAAQAREARQIIGLMRETRLDSFSSLEGDVLDKVAARAMQDLSSHVLVTEYANTANERLAHLLD